MTREGIGLGAHSNFTSVTRIADLEPPDIQGTSLEREGWATGDYVLVEVVSQESGRGVEGRTGRMIELTEGDVLVGALGRRLATLEETGSWEDVGDDGSSPPASGQAGDG